MFERPIIQYGKVELNAKQKANFSAIISDLSNETQDAFAACIFDPHHSILFIPTASLPALWISASCAAKLNGKAVQKHRLGQFILVLVK